MIKTCETWAYECIEKATNTNDAATAANLDGTTLITSTGVARDFAYVTSHGI
jgi:hypothetical protein